jgi:uridine phosphorylase
VAHLHPTADLAERALLPDDPGQALALTRVLFGETPRMFNHHRGLWGYSGTALDGAPLTVQSTGIGGPSAAIVVAELHALGLRRAVRIGRALGAGARIEPDGALRAQLRSDRSGVLASADVELADDEWDALAFDLESAAVLAAAARAGIPAACLLAIEGPVEPEDVAERLGRAALPALAPVRA